MPDDVYDFELAAKAFGRFSLPEKRTALKLMAQLQYPSVEDRFFEAVSQVIAKAGLEPRDVR